MVTYFIKIKFKWFNEYESIIIRDYEQIFGYLVIQVQ